MRKPTKTSVTNKLDRECSRIVRSIGFCQWGATKNCTKGDYELLQCAHIFSRTYKSVRWDLKNMICLCASCHFYGHNNPTRFTEFVKRYLGEVEYQMLDQRANPTSHWKMYQMQELLKTLNNIGDNNA
mgnify:CR=1 FL=1